MKTIALLTDYGRIDDYVGLLHATILKADGSARIVDLCHDIEPGNIEQAAFYLIHDAGYFPADTVFVAVVDPGVGTSRNILAARVVHEDGTARSFIAPDNGLLDPVIDWWRNSGFQVQVFADNVETVRPKLVKEGLELPEILFRTFDGRDMFAPLAVRFAQGLDPGDYLTPTESWETTDWRSPRANSGASLGKVMFTDHFGNVITDIPVDGRKGQVVILSQRLTGVDTFSDIPRGEIAWLRGSKGTVEIVMNGVSAAEALEVERGEAVVFAVEDESDGNS